MSKRTISLAIALTMALGALGAPTAAIEPPGVRFLNAIAGKRIDVCVDGVQVARNLKYKKMLVLDALAAGVHKIQVTKGNKPGPCTTKKLAVLTFSLVDNDSVTLVGHRRFKPYVITRFDNDISLPAPDVASVVMRNVANVKSVDFWAWSQISQSAIGPSVTLRRGKTSDTIVVPATWTIITAIPSKRWRDRSWLKNLKAGHVYEFYAMGDSRTSFRVKLLEQDGDVS